MSEKNYQAETFSLVKKKTLGAIAHAQEHTRAGKGSKDSKMKNYLLEIKYQ